MTQTSEPESILYFGDHPVVNNETLSYQQAQEPIKYNFKLLPGEIYTEALYNRSYNNFEYLSVNIQLHPETESISSDLIVAYEALQPNGKKANIYHYLIWRQPPGKEISQGRILEIQDRYDDNKLKMGALVKGFRLFPVHKLSFKVDLPLLTESQIEMKETQLLTSSNQLTPSSSKTKSRFQPEAPELIEEGDERSVGQDRSQLIIGNLEWQNRKYQVLKKIGQGTYGGVFTIQFHDEPLQTYALKAQLLRNDHDMAVVRSEMEIWNYLTLKSELNQVNNYLAQFYLGELVKFDNKNYALLYMEYVQGPDLSDFIDSYQPKTARLSPEVMVRIIDRLTAAVDFVHSQGVAHHDIKAENAVIEVDPDNPEVYYYDRIKLVDFGLSCVQSKSAMNILQKARTCRHGAVGSPLYMAPELILPKLGYDPYLADTYSLGMTFYYLAERNFPLDVSRAADPRKPAPEMLGSYWKSGIKALIYLSYPYRDIDEMVESLMTYDPSKRKTLKYSRANQLPALIRKYIPGSIQIQGKKGEGTQLCVPNRKSDPSLHQSASECPVGWSAIDLKGPSSTY